VSGGAVANEKILIIDDKVDLAQACARFLFHEFGCEAILAQGGRQGLEIALDERPDLVILDFKLPEMSGLDVLRALRSNQVHIPVIFITAYGSEEDIISAFRLGVKDYFTKPFDLSELAAAVQRILAEERQIGAQERRRRRLERQVKELAALYGSSVQSVLNHIVEAAVAIADAEEGYILLLDAEKTELYMRSALNIGESYASGFRVRVKDSIAGRVVATGKPVRYNNIDDSGLFKVKTGYLTKALINVPLRVGDEIIGVLGVDNRGKSETFSREDLSLLIILAEHAATAINNASLYEQTHQALVRRVQELSTMQQVTRDLNAVMDVRRIGSIVLSHSMRIASAEAGLVGLQVGEAVEWIGEGYVASALGGENWAPDWNLGAIGQAVKSARPVLLNDLSRVLGNVYTLPQTRSQHVIPILRGGQVLGIIDLESTQSNALSQDDVQLLLNLADQAAVALENARLFDMVIDEQSKTRLVLQSIADGVYAVDRDLRITALNPAAERITGWPEAGAKGQPISAVFEDADGDEAYHQCSLIQRAIDTGRPVVSSPDDPPIQDRTGKEVFVSSSVAPVYSKKGQIVGAVGVLRDVSAERELDRLQSDFVSMISHELRSPLANLGAAVELMSISMDDVELLQKTLSIARDNQERLTRLVEDILSVSQIEAGQMKVQEEPVTLLPILRRVIRIAQSQTKRHRILLHCPEQVPFVMADQSKVEIVVNNLVANAINYSPEGERVLIKVSGPANDEIMVSVIDEGVGIPQDHLEKVFDRFYRVDSSDGRKVYGHGLGLYISKSLVELQGGRIWAQSKEGRGSCFSFTLPVVEEAEIVSEDRVMFASQGRTRPLALPRSARRGEGK
jgi:PAS domain S-box-containing protein